MKTFVFCSLLFLAACNSVYLKPGTMEPNTIVHVDPAGEGIARNIKEILEQRGYDVRIGSQRPSGKNGLSSSDIVVLPGATNYIIRTVNSTESFMPWWCIFNGFWWWKFNLSITAQNTGKEILSWRGRGCQNSSLRKLNGFLDELEIKPNKDEYHD